ncbi:MAG: hypothetical protein QME51_11550 [Planctomycetota bacterium]|nr:hypothetical protein [Planctomycetota bacterium]
MNKKTAVFIIGLLFAALMVIVIVSAISCRNTAVDMTKTIIPTTEDIELTGKVNLETGDIKLEGKAKIDSKEITNPSVDGKGKSMIIGLWHLFFGLILATMLVSWVASFWVKFIPKRILAIAVNALAMVTAWLILGYHYLDVLVCGLLALAVSGYLYDVAGRKALDLTKQGITGLAYRLVGKKR